MLQPPLTRHLRDLDQIHDDLRSPRHLEQYKETKSVEELPGLGKHYCVECAKWFETEVSLVSHRKGKPHRRRYVPRKILLSRRPWLFLCFESLPPFSDVFSPGW